MLLTCSLNGRKESLSDVHQVISCVFLIALEHDNEIAQEHGVHPDQASQLLENAGILSEGKRGPKQVNTQSNMEPDWLKKSQGLALLDERQSWNPPLYSIPSEFQHKATV